MSYKEYKRKPLSFKDRESLYSIPGYEGRYSITKDGRVYAELENSTGRAKNKYGKWLKPQVTWQGYRMVTLMSHDRCKISRLVARTFLGEPNDVSLVVDHINRVNSDDRVENLRWVTQAENLLNRVLTKRKKTYVNRVTNKVRYKTISGLK